MVKDVRKVKLMGSINGGRTWKDQMASFEQISLYFIELRKRLRRIVVDEGTEIFEDTKIRCLKLLENC